MNGYVSKKRRKQSKPIRLGSEEGGEGGEGGEGVEGGEEGCEDEGDMEEGEVRHGVAPADMRFANVEDDVCQDDAPLNLSSGVKNDDDKEVGSLRVRGRELLQNPDKIQENHSNPSYPLGFSSHFGLPPHFLFPFSGMPGGPASPGSESEQGFTPPTSHGGKTQIFNIEAYCKLCNKEFCNKYFLKTHMANKHGIYSDAGIVPTSGQRFDSLTLGGGGSGMFEQGMRMPSVSMMSSMAHTPVSISGSFMAMASMRPSLETSPRMSLGLDSIVRSKGIHENKSPHESPDHQGSLEASPARMSPKTGPPPLISGDERSESSNEREQGEITNNKETESEPRKLEDMNNLPPSLRLSMVPHMNPFGPLPFFNMNMGPMDLMRKEEERKDMMNIPTSMSSPRPIPNIPNVPNSSSSSGSKGSMTPDKLRQMGVINADAFCEFCCKEFCNKYFLRVHKLKKHGVCSPELPPEKVQKILAQMAKEAGKTGQPMPPLTLGTPSMIRPPSTLSDPPKSIGGPLGSPLNLIRPPTLPNFLNLPPLDPISYGREDTRSSSSSDKPDEREEGRPINLQFSPRQMIEPECELKIDESASVIKSPLPEVSGDQSQSSDEVEQRNPENCESAEDENKGRETNEGLANLQNMIMKLNNGKSKLTSQENTTVCKKCNKDMENKYFLHAHMMNEHGMLNAEEEEGFRPSNMSISLPQYPADLSKLTELQGMKSPGLNIPCPIMSRPMSHSPQSNGLPKLSEKPMDYPKSIFEQIQGLPRPSFLDQMKKELGGKMDLSPLKRPSLDRDPNKKPASLSRSYCEICKKELCNKYFMKTHMMKMHGIVMEQGPPSNSINCEICKKEVSSKYFLKVHMGNAHGLNEDGSPIPPHMRENSLMNMFPMGDYPPPPLGEFSRLLMQQGEKNMERMKELDRMKDSQGHVCSLCSNTFSDIVTLQVHIIKSHGALPPTSGLDGILSKNRDQERDENGRLEREGSQEEDDDITDRDEEEKQGDEDGKEIPSPFPFPLDFHKMQSQGGLKNSPINDILQRQMMGQFPGGLMNPLLLPGLAGPGGGGQQFQGLFNMFLSEMLKKVQKDTPPQTPPVSPSPGHTPSEEQMEEATS